MKKTLYILLGLLLSLQGLAATRTWTGAVNTDWTNSGNWSGNSVPGSNDKAIIPTIANGNYPIITTSVTLKDLQISDWSNGKLTVGINGSLTVEEDVDLNNNGTLTIDGGSFLHEGDFSMGYTNTRIEVLSGSFVMEDKLQVNGEFDVTSGTVEFEDDFTLPSGKNFYAGTGDITFRGKIEIFGVLYGEAASMNFYKKGGNDKTEIKNGGRLILTTGSATFHDKVEVKSNGFIEVADGSVSFDENIKFESSAGISVNDGTIDFDGNTEFKNTASLDILGSGNVEIGGKSTLKSSGTINVGSGSLSIDGELKVQNTGTVNATDGNLTLNGNLKLDNSNATMNMGTSTMNFNGGKFTNDGNFNADSSTVVLSGGADQEIDGDVTFYNLEVETDGELLIDGDIIVLNDASIDADTDVEIEGENTLNVQGDFNDFSGTALVAANRPFIKYVTIQSATSILLEFNEALDETSAETIGNYALSPGQTPQTATLNPVNATQVTLTFTPGIAFGTEYSLVMNNIQNTAGKAISTNHTKRFDGDFTSSPTTPSNNALFTRTPTSLTINFTKGDGDGRLVLISTTPGFDAITNNTTYSVESDFSLATPFSGETYAVAVGDIASFTVTNLDQNTTYYFSIVEYNGSAGSELYGATYNFETHTDLFLELTLFLEGPYNPSTGLMDNDLNQLGFLPTQQPFNDSIWNYDGTEQVSTIPSTMVDWVLVELRKAPNASSATQDSIVFRKACILHTDGSISNPDGSDLEADLFEAGDYYLSIIHQTHLISLTANALSANSNGNYSWDFSQSNSVFGDELVEESGVYLIPTAKIETRDDSSINTEELYDLIWEKRGRVEYSDYDIDRNGQVSASDRASLFNNKNKSKNVDND